MGPNSNIDLTGDQRRLVVELIKRHLPYTDVWAYGSRVTWTSRPQSDLDLVVFSGPEQTGQVSDLRESFEDSDLPFQVDVLVWDDLPESFHEEIDENHCPVVEVRTPDSTTKMRFGDCATLIRDHVDPSDLPGDTPYVGLGHIPKNQLLVANHGVAGDVTSVKSRFKRGDILFGGLRPYFRKMALARYDGICSTDIWVVRAQDGLDHQFLFYQMATQHFVDYASQGSEGTKMPRAKWDHVSEYHFSVPCLDEQRRVAKILGEIDDKIRVNHRMNSKLRRMVEAIFRSLIGQMNCIHHQEMRDVLHNETRDSADVVSTHTSTAWRRTTLGEVVEIHSGGTPATSIASYWDGDIPWFTAKDAPSSDEVFAVDTLRKISEAGLDNSAAEVLPRYTTAITARGTVGKLACLAVPMALNQTCYGLRGVGYPDFFVYWMMKTITVQLQRQSHGSIFDTITRQSFDAVSIVVPPPDVADKLEECIDPLMKHILANLHDIRVLSKLRDCLLERLL